MLIKLDNFTEFIRRVNISINPVNPVGPDSGCNSNNDPTPSGKEEFEAAYYSSEMFNFFETQFYRNGLRSTIDATASADSFIPTSAHRITTKDLFDLRQWDNYSKAAISIGNDRWSIRPTTFQFIYALKYACRTVRDIFLKHYSHFTFHHENRNPEGEDDDNYQEVTVMARPGIWFDMEVDTLYLANMSLLPRLHTGDIYDVSFDFTALRSLTIDMIDVIDIHWLGGTEQDMYIFWTELESYCPALERLNIGFNNIYDFPRHHRGFDGTCPKHRFQYFNEAFVEQLRHGQWVQPRIYSDKIEGDIQMSRELWETRTPKAEQANMDYWKEIDLRPVWMVYITSFYADHARREVIPGPLMAVQTSGDQRFL
ncbi:hypothetical protein EAF00_005399 [Botryotinia globosa]|nr:hypothetical protein EAF00_005399 [Botryotinia globosa]